MSQSEMYADNPYGQFGRSVAEATPDVRVDFIRRTYTHLAAAIYAFIAVEWALFKLLPVEELVNSLFAFRFGWLAVLGGFMLVSVIADRWARSDTSIGIQYLGLTVYVLAEAIVFLPLLYLAQGMTVSVPGIGAVSAIAVAGVTTLAIVGVLTAIVWISRADFSFLRSALVVGSIGAFALIVMSIFMGWNLGVWFSVGMVVFACMAILYNTSNVLHYYQPTQHVAAALALFASVALLFWYILQLFMSRD